MKPVVVSEGRPEAKLLAKVMLAEGGVVDLGQVSGPGITRADKKKNKAGRKFLDERAARIKKEARNGG